MVSKSAANRDRLAAGSGPIAGGGPGPPEGEACLVSPPLFLAPVSPLPGSSGVVAQHVLGELPLAGQQPFRQLGPPGITVARHPSLPAHPPESDPAN